MTLAFQKDFCMVILPLLSSVDHFLFSWYFCPYTHTPYWIVLRKKYSMYSHSNLIANDYASEYMIVMNNYCVQSIPYCKVRQPRLEGSLARSTAWARLNDTWRARCIYQCLTGRGLRMLSWQAGETASSLIWLVLPYSTVNRKKKNTENTWSPPYKRTMITR